MITKGSFGLNAVNGLLLAVLLVVTVATVAISSETGPSYGIKDAEFAKSGIRPDKDITEFTMFLRIKNTHPVTVKMPETDYTVFYGDQDIGSGTITQLRIPPMGTLPFPMVWEIPEDVTAGQLFEIQKGSQDVRVEMTMHATLLGMPHDIPLTIVFGENEATVF